MVGRTDKQSQTCDGAVELTAGCHSWAPQSPESLLTPGPKEPEEREEGEGGVEGAVQSEERGGGGERREERKGKGKD